MVRLVPPLLVLVACTDAPVEVLQTGPPTYYEDVTPILARACWCCHQAEGLAFSLTAVAEVQSDIERILRSMEEGTMPPGTAIAAPGCAPLDAPVASAGDLAVLQAWHDSGQPLGDPSLASPVPAACGVLRSPVRRFTNDGYTFTAATSVESRCFVLDATFEEDQFLTGARVERGDAVVRSVLLQPAPVGRAPLESFDCPLGTSDLVPPVILAFGTPRSKDVIFPAGSGVRIEAGTQLMLRVQYDSALATTPGPTTVETAINLALAASVERAAEIALVYDEGLRLSPGEERVDGEVVSLFRPGIRVHELAVWMHDRGRSARVELVRDGETRCLIDFPAWSIGSAHLYRFATPIDLSGGTVRTRCAFDTSADREPVVWGDPPASEVCLATAIVTLP